MIPAPMILVTTTPTGAVGAMMIAMEEEAVTAMALLLATTTEGKGATMIGARTMTAEMTTTVGTSWSTSPTPR